MEPFKYWSGAVAVDVDSGPQQQQQMERERIAAVLMFYYI